ncbi:MAG: hypothetical protein H0V29_11360 [Thermoleophilaceae bacterium]|nr:hypothetical protein [Thermoleophilaceae bacterium]
MGRIGRGWTLTKKSWSVLRADRSLFLFPVISFIATVGAMVIIGGPAAAAYAGAENNEYVLIPFALVGLYALTFIAVFFGTALAGAAAKSLHGEDSKFADGMAVARSRLPQIAAWAAVQATVGAIISAIQGALENNARGQIFAGLLNFAWAAATFFVIPIIALEGLGPRDAFKRSVSILRERWGEGVVGSAAIGGLIFLAMLLPLIVLVGGGLAVQDSSQGGALALWALAAVIFAIGVLLSAALNAVFRVALYDFAVNGRTEGAFTQEELTAAFRPKKTRGR